MARSKNRNRDRSSVNENEVDVNDEVEIDAEELDADENETDAEDEEVVEEPALSGKSVPVKLLVDVWDHKGDRHRAGKEMDLPVEQARGLLKEGKVQRNDPLPGDE